MVKTFHSRKIFFLLGFFISFIKLVDAAPSPELQRMGNSSLISKEILVNAQARNPNQVTLDSVINTNKNMGEEYLSTALVKDLPIGKSLIGEDCTLSFAEDFEQTSSNQVKYISCNKSMIGTAFAESKIPINTALFPNDLIPTVLEQFSRSSAFNQLSQKMKCSKPSLLSELNELIDKNIIALPCSLNNGGWQELILIRSEGDKMFIAHGSPSLMPVLINALYENKKVDAALNITLNSYSAMLKTIWGKPIKFLSSSDQIYVNQLIEQAKVANSINQDQESEVLFSKALQIQSQLLGDDAEELVNILLDLALSASNNGNFDVSTGKFTRAEQLIQKSTDVKLKAKYLTYLGYDAANRREYKTALEYAQDASMAWRKINEQIVNNPFLGMIADQDSQEAAFAEIDEGERAMALNFEAKMLLRNNDLVSAQTKILEAVQIIIKKNNFPAFWSAEILITFGDISIAQGKISDADDSYNKALKIYKSLSGDSSNTIDILMKIGSARQKEGLFTNAIISFREAIKIAKSLPNKSGKLSSDQLANYASAVISLANTLENKNDILGLQAEIFDAFQLQKSSNVDKTLSKISSKILTNDKKLLALMDDIYSLERIIQVDKNQLAYEASLLDGQRSKIVEDQLIDKLEKNNKQLIVFNEQLKNDFPDFLAKTANKTIQLNDLQSYLSSKEAIVLFLLGSQKSYIQMITSKQTFLHEIAQGDQDFYKDILSLRKGLEIESGKVKEFDLVKSNSIYMNLFSKLEQEIKKIDHLIVVPSGPLSSLPFSVLVTQINANQDYAQAKWLINEVAITHTPSLKSFYEKRSTVPGTQPTKTFLAFGDPILANSLSNSKNLDNKTANLIKTVANSKSSIKSPIKLLKTSEEDKILSTPTGKIICLEKGPIPAEILNALPSLPDTRTEIENVMRSLGITDTKDIYLGKNALEPNLRNLTLTDYRVIYFATHGLLPGEVKCQLEPGLVLTPPPKAAKTKYEDGLLGVSEIIELKLNADLVVLSACNTAGDKNTFGGESLTGLVEAFFFAGAHNLLVSHWSVPSKATSQLMSQLFVNLGPKLANGTASSLQQAQLNMLKSPSTSHPVFWGAFVLMGDGAVEGVGSKPIFSSVK